MLPRKYDTTLALKAIGLTDKLTGTEKRIAATLLDHFNRKTGRCDPSQETMATLLLIHRRTVNRGIKKVVKIGFFAMVRHGGNNHCNSYQPCWKLFRALEERWKRERRQHADRFRRQEVSPSAGQSCPTGGGVIVSQTCSTNLIPLTSPPVQDPPTKPEHAGLDTPIGSANGLGVFAARIERRLGRDDYRAWFRNVRFVEVMDGKVVLSAETNFFRSRIEQQFEWKILECFRREYPDVVRLQVILRRPDG